MTDQHNQMKTALDQLLVLLQTAASSTQTLRYKGVDYGPGQHARAFALALLDVEKALGIEHDAKDAGKPLALGNVLRLRSPLYVTDVEAAPAGTEVVIVGLERNGDLRVMVPALGTVYLEKPFDFDVIRS